jgi:hypothetical protein
MDVERLAALICARVPSGLRLPASIVADACNGAAEVAALADFVRGHVRALGCFATWGDGASGSARRCVCWDRGGAALRTHCIAAPDAAHRWLMLLVDLRDCVGRLTAVTRFRCRVGGAAVRRWW